MHEAPGRPWEPAARRFRATDAAAERDVDFIKRSIFPGSCIPSVSVLVSTLSAAGDLLLTDLEDIGLHYARTQNHWPGNCVRQLGEVRALGHSEEFIRMWTSKGPQP